MRAPGPHVMAAVQPHIMTTIPWAVQDAGAAPIHSLLLKSHTYTVVRLAISVKVCVQRSTKQGKGLTMKAWGRYAIIHTCEPTHLHALALCL